MGQIQYICFSGKKISLNYFTYQLKIVLALHGLTRHSRMASYQTQLFLHCIGHFNSCPDKL